jgi:hypothetical protein
MKCSTDDGDTIKTTKGAYVHLMARQRPLVLGAAAAAAAPNDVPHLRSTKWPTLPPDTPHVWLRIWDSELLHTPQGRHAVVGASCEIHTGDHDAQARVSCYVSCK